MPIITLTAGPSFQAKDGLSILGAAALAGVRLPYSCKNGRCCTCKCKVKDGLTEALSPELGLSEEQRNEGWILSCVRTAKSDIVLEADDFGRFDLPEVKTWPCRISQINFLTPDVAQVFLRLPPSVEFKFIPGQYIDVIGRNGIRRSYSLANSSFTNKLLELHIRLVEGGVLSNYWFNSAKVNDLLHLSGPLGTFFLRETAGLDLIFLATGTGIAPVKSIVGSLVDLPNNKTPRSLTVLWGGRQRSDLYFDFSAISDEQAYIPVLSRSDESWRGATGYVQDVLISMSPEWGGVAVYACGSYEMIQSSQRVLVAAGLSPDRFFSDAFVSSSVN